MISVISQHCKGLTGYQVRRKIQIKKVDDIISRREFLVRVRASAVAAVVLPGTASGDVETKNKVFLNNAMIGADKAVRTGFDGNTLDYNCYWYTPGKCPRPFE